MMVQVTSRVVLMNFMEWRKGWRVSFTEADCQTSLPKKLTFATPDKIRIMQQRFSSQLLDDKNALEHGISMVGQRVAHTG